MSASRDVVERTRRAVDRASALSGGDTQSAFKLLCETARSDPLVMEGMSEALVGDTFAVTGAVEVKNAIGQIELWVKAMGATRH